MTGNIWRVRGPGVEVDMSVKSDGVGVTGGVVDGEDSTMCIVSDVPDSEGEDASTAEGEDGAAT